MAPHAAAPVPVHARQDHPRRLRPRRSCVVALVLVKMASAPSYTTVMAGLDPAQTGKITAALDRKGIKYEIRNNGTRSPSTRARSARRASRSPRRA